MLLHSRRAQHRAPQKHTIKHATVNTAARLISPSLPDELSDSEFEQFQRLAYDWAGINIEDQQRAMLYSRFCRRLRDLDMACFSEYIAYAEDNASRERELFVNKVTTNLTYFFREPHHFEHLVSKAVPSMTSQGTSTSRIRIWSAACSSGQEPYSIAIALADKRLHKQSNFRILCTDINTEMVRKTRSGNFPQSDLRGLEERHRRQWFSEHGDRLTASQELRDMMVCNTLNLFANWPFSGHVDAIFCRNALIYFNRELQAQLIKRFAGVQRPGSYLYLGHSEVVDGIRDYYEREENTVFRRLP